MKNSKVGNSALQSGKTITGLLGNTDISSVGSTITGAISALNSKGKIDLLGISSGTILNNGEENIKIPDIRNYKLIEVIHSQYVDGGSSPCQPIIIPVPFIVLDLKDGSKNAGAFQTDGDANNWYMNFKFTSYTNFKLLNARGAYALSNKVFIYGINF